MNVTRRRAWLLLESLVAITLLVGASLVVLSLMSTHVRALARHRDVVHATNLASSAMARIACGLDTPESLSGPVGSHGEDGRASAWDLKIEVNPSSIAGLTSVAVIARKVDGQGEMVPLARVDRMVALDGAGVTAPVDELAEGGL